MAETPLLQNVLDKLEETRVSGNGYSALCPAHPDSEASLSVKLGDNGSVIMNCHRGCAKSDIVDALGMTMQQLWPPDDNKKKKQKTKKEFVESYDYVDKDGALVFQVVKFADPEGKKSFGQRVPQDGGWNWSTTHIQKPIYQLPKIRKAITAGEPIYIAEGEKDVHTLEKAGLVATTNPGGSNAWFPQHTAAVKDASQIFIICDNDTAGYKHAKHVSSELGTTVHTILAPPLEYNDVTDMVEAGLGLDALIEPVIEEVELDEYQELLAQLKPIADKEWSIETKLTRAQSILSNHDVQIVDTGRLTKWTDFLKETQDPYDWIIPGLLERQDRVIVVAAEGVGKTMLARQVALTTAAGTHPFTRAPQPKIRTLFVDLENPQRIIRRTSTQIMDAIQRLRPTYELDAHLYSKPDGLNILKKEDQHLLENLIEQTQPDLICLGPLYKTFIDPGGRTSEAITTEAAMYLDYLRITYNTALWLEHHAPLGTDTTRQLRPFGSSVWSRWPEFGLALTPDTTIPYRYDLKHFRGAREERDWPKALHRDTTLPFAAEWT